MRIQILILGFKGLTTAEGKRKPIQSQKWEENSVLGVAQYSSRQV